MIGAGGVRLAGLAVGLVVSLPAFAGDLLDTDIHRLTRTEILEEGRALPDSGYLSTGQPDAEVLERIAAAGFVAVVDLRGSDEDRGIDEKAAVEALGMDYITLPLPNPEDATFEAAATLDAMLSEVEGPVLLHCFTGNRVGALFALTAKTEGLSSEDALEFGRKAGLTRWEGAVKEELGLE